MAALPVSLGISGILSGLLDDSSKGNIAGSKDIAKIQGQTARDVAEIRTTGARNVAEIQALTAGDIAAGAARRTFPGQRSLAKNVAPFLWENIDVGLTEKEKEHYRDTGRTNILKGIESTKRGVTRAAASQGLRGGAVADIVSGVYESQYPLFGKLESDITSMDISRKKQRVAELLAFLGLESGYDLGEVPRSEFPEIPSTKTTPTNQTPQTIERIITGLVVDNTGPGVGPAEGPGTTGGFGSGGVGDAGGGPTPGTGMGGR